MWHVFSRCTNAVQQLQQLSIWHVFRRSSSEERLCNSRNSDVMADAAPLPCNSCNSDDRRCTNAVRQL